MSDTFSDYYELLQLSPNADAELIDRVFRHLAKKYHPDHQVSPDPDKFRLLLEAHKTLSDPEARAGYDAKYHEYWNRKWKLAEEASKGGAFTDDHETRERLLSLLYIQRRRDMRAPGLGEYELARLLRTPVELVGFHLWYLREKGWVTRLETGHLAISASGVDQIEQGRLRLSDDRLLAAHAGAGAKGNGNGNGHHDDQAGWTTPSLEEGPGRLPPHAGW